MEAENIEFRRGKVLTFVKVYAGFILICIMITYWSFCKIPAVDRHDRLSTSSYFDAFIKKSTEAQKLSYQIWNTPEVKQSSVIAYYEWVGQLKDNYRREVLVKVLDGYLTQTDEILNKSKNDSVLIALEKDYRILKSQNAMLTNDNALLSSQLAEKKALRTNQ